MQKQSQSNGVILRYNMANLLKVQVFRTNDIVDDGGKQFELGKNWCEDFFGIDSSLHEYTINLKFKSISREFNYLNDKIIELKLADVSNRGDRKAYSNSDSGRSQIKDFFIDDLRLNEFNIKRDYFAILSAQNEFFLYFVPKELYDNFIKLFNSTSTTVSVEPTLLETEQEIKTQQIIYYGAPGTGKSHAIEVATEGQDVIRTTFHPDSDYSTFVGAYKPTTKEIPMRDVTGKVIIENGEKVTENRIVYEFVSQAFLQAYVGAWEKFASNGDQPQPQYLVIEEINRGNCAQIFGDLFQLLDRNNKGFSEYPIKADADMKKQLNRLLKGLTIENPDKINALYKGMDIMGQVLDGDILLLPSNLYIWATMNTSDQSLFPIDSAFKRRWEWRYVRIDNAHKDWKIEANGKKYDWWDFLEKINAIVGETTSSEDKKLGYFFCKTPNGIISSETFVSKVIFYLWNDVFKDYEFEGDVFNDEPIEGKTNKLSFDKFYLTDATGKTVVNESKVDVFLTNLGVRFDDDEEDELDNNDENNEAKRNIANRLLLSVAFPDGSKFDTDDGLTHFAVYYESIKKIGVERVEPIAAASKYHRLKRPVISKERFPEIEESNRYSYEQLGEYFLIKGMSEDTYINILNLCNEQLNLGIDVKYKE